MFSIKSLVSNSAIYGIGSVLTKSMSLLALPIFTNYLSPSEYGVLSLILLLSALINPIITLGLNMSMGIAYFKSDSLSNKSQTIWSSFILLCLSSAIFIFIVLVFIENITQFIFQSQEYNFLLFLAIVSMCLNVITTPFMLRIQFESRAKIFVLLSFLSSILTILFSVYFVVNMNKNIEGMIYGQLIGSFFLFSSFFYLGKKELFYKFNAYKFKEVFLIGYPLIPSSIFLLIILQSNRYILERFEGLEAVGIYSIGFSFGMLMSILVGAFTKAWYPYFMSFSQKQDEIKDKFGNILFFYVVIFGTLSLLFFVFSKQIVFIFVSEEYASSYKLIGFIALSQFFIGLFSIFTPSIYYLSKVAVVSYLQGACAVLSIIINFVMIKTLGMLGAAIGLLVSTSLLPLFQYFCNKYFLKDCVQIEYSLSSSIYISIIVFLGIGMTFFINPFLLLAGYIVVMSFIVAYQKPNFLNLLKKLNRRIYVK